VSKTGQAQLVETRFTAEHHPGFQNGRITGVKKWSFVDLEAQAVTGVMAGKLKYVVALGKVKHGLIHLTAGNPWSNRLKGDLLHGYHDLKEFTLASTNRPQNHGAFQLSMVTGEAGAAPGNQHISRL
jgi:hypothetical protein